MARKSRRLGSVLTYEDLWDVTNRAAEACRQKHGKSSPKCITDFRNGATAMFNAHKRKGR